MINKAVFLDKDGTLITDVPYNTDPDKIKLERDCVDGLKKLQHAHYKLIIISNQSGVALGHFNEVLLEGVKVKIQELLQNEGIVLDAFYYCPHHPEGQVEEYALICDCRKPMPGMLLQAAKDWSVDLSQSWMIGDILNDVEAGNKAGCKTILIDNGNETEWVMNEERYPDFKTSSINNAATYILNQSIT